MLVQRVDLHVHTVLSPCAEVEMTPPLIVQRARHLGLDIIAVTDHNSAANAGAVVEAARKAGITALPGMEVQTREEVHVLCLFDTVAQAEDWQQVIDASLPDLLNRESFFGPQYVVDASGAYVRTERRLLSTSTALTLEQVAEGVRERGGICLPAHVERPSFSLLANLGFIPPDLPVAGIEFSPLALDLAKFVHSEREKAANRLGGSAGRGFSSDPGEGSARSIPGLPKTPVLTRFAEAVECLAGLVRYGVIVNSDAHRLADLRAYTQAHVVEPTIAELRCALGAERGRRIELL